MAKDRGRPKGALGQAALAASALLAWSQAEAFACTPGQETCPVVLRMAPGAVSIDGIGTVSGERPDFFFRFEAGAGQTMTVHVVGGNIKKGPGIPITLPDGRDDAVDVDTPYRLPLSGTYGIVMHANTMSEGPFGPLQDDASDRLIAARDTRAIKCAV